jgi:DNA-damage-inducible protein J
MIATVNVTVRVEEETKKQFDAFCDSVGINMTSAVNMFIKTVLRNRELPFVITDVDERQLTLARARGALKAMQDMSALNGNSKMTLDEINAEIAEARNDHE